LATVGALAKAGQPKANLVAIGYPPSFAISVGRFRGVAARARRCRASPRRSRNVMSIVSLVLTRAAICLMTNTTAATGEAPRQDGLSCDAPDRLFPSFAHFAKQRSRPTPLPEQRRGRHEQD